MRVVQIGHVSRDAPAFVTRTKNASATTNAQRTGTRVASAEVDRRSIAVITTFGVPTVSSLRHLSLVALLVSSLAAALRGQLPEWGTFTPSSTPTLFAESSIVSVRDADGYHLWSSYTRTWSDLSVTSPTFYGCDDHCVVVDGNTAWGYATRQAKWVPQPLSAAPTAPTPNSGPVWMTVLLDGNAAHVFSGLLGTWATVTFGGPVTAKVGRMFAVLTDGTRTVGLSAHFNSPVDLGPTPVTSIDGVGYCGVARSANYFHMFSAYRNTWRAITASPTATLTKPAARAGYVVVREASSMNFWSALTNEQVLLFHAPSAVLNVQENVAAIQDGNTLFAYSCAASTIGVVSTPTAWVQLDVRRFLVAASDGLNVYAFGVQAGAFAHLPGAFFVASDTGVALATPGAGGDTWAFSSMTNEWVAAPANTYTQSFLTFNAAVLVDTAGGLAGFSVNRATWAVDATPAADAYFKSQAMFCARAGNRLDVFNGRSGEWATVTTAAPAAVTCFDMAVLADDGSNVHTFGVYRDAWSSHPVASVQKQLRDECAYVYDGTDVHVWSGSGQTSEWANYPEYWRILARGGKLHYNIAAEPASFAATFVALAPIPPTVTPWGLLQIDPGTIVFPLPVVVPLEGTGEIDLTIPDDTSLRGVTLWTQSLILAPAAPAYLTNAFESTIL